MVGRTPEYLGKKIETREMKLAMLAVLDLSARRARLLGRFGDAADALDSLDNAGPHGLSEILYAFASTNANNGSAFAGLRQHALVQHDARPRHGVRPLRLRDPGARHRRLARREEKGAGLRRHLPDRTGRCSSAC